MGMRRELTQLSKAYNELSKNAEIYIDDTPARRTYDTDRGQRPGVSKGEVRSAC